MTETEQLKQQLVDCIRMLEQSDIIDYNGHASIRVGDGRMLINIGSCQRSRLTVDDICTIDIEGNVIEGNGKPPLEFHLHAGIYQARAGREGGRARAPEVVHLPHHGRRELPAGVRAGLAGLPDAGARLAELDQQPGDGRAPGRHARATGRRR